MKRKLLVGFTVLAVVAIGLWASSASAAEMKFGGYAKFDTVYRNNNTANEAFSGGAVPIRNCGAPAPAVTAVLAPPCTTVSAVFDQTNELRLTARQSRMNFTLTEKVGNISFRGFVEGDFYGNATTGGGEMTTGSANLRLRHAFVEASWPGGFSILAGQTWNTFTDLPSGADTLDFGGPVGAADGRSAQLRLSQKLTDNLTAVLSFENPEVAWPNAGGGVTGTMDPAFGGGAFGTTAPIMNALVARSFGAGGGTSAAPDVAPDIIGKLSWRSPIGYLSVYGVMRTFHTKLIVGGAPTTVAGGGGFSHRLPIPFIQGLDLFGTVTGGNGVGRYYAGGTGPGFPDAVIDGGGGITGVPEIGFYEGLEYVTGPVKLYTLYSHIQAFSTTFGSIIPTNFGLFGYGTNASGISACLRGITGNPTACASNQTKMLHNVFVGGWYNLAPSYRVGLEYNWAKRFLFNSVCTGAVTGVDAACAVGGSPERSGQTHTVQAAIQYFF